MPTPATATIHQPVSPRPTPQRGSSGGRARFVGVDLARFLAIAGMMATHLIAINAMNPAASEFERGAAQLAQTLTSGIAAPLFAVLGGLSSVFATRRLLREGRTGAAIGAVALRGAILILVGLLLALVVSPVVVVLAYYGTAMILVAPLIAARGPVLVAIAAVLGLAGGPLNASVRSGLGIVNEGGSVSFELFAADPAGALRALAITGEYPAITWVVYLLAGMLIGRLLVSASGRGILVRVSAILAGIGAAAATAAQLASGWVTAHLSVFGFAPVEGVDPEMFRTMLVSPTYGAPFSTDLWAQLVATPHSGSPMDLIRTIGISLAVIGMLVLVCDNGKRGTGELGTGELGGGTSGGGPAARALDAVRATGAAPLTVYALHIVVTGLVLTPLFENPSLLESGIPWWAAGTTAFALQIGGALVIGAILSATGRRGPLEAATSGIVRLAVRG